MSRLGSWAGDIIQIWAELPNLAKMLTKVYYLDFLRAQRKIYIWRPVAACRTIWQLWEKLKLLECYVIPLFPGFWGQWTRPWCYFNDLRSRSPFKVNLKVNFLLKLYFFSFNGLVGIFFQLLLNFMVKLLNFKLF